VTGFSETVVSPCTGVTNASAAKRMPS